MAGAQLIVEELPEARCTKLCFENDRPGHRWCENFCFTHKYLLKLSTAMPEETQRYRACSAETFTNYFADVKNLIKTYKIDPSRM